MKTLKKLVDLSIKKSTNLEEEFKANIPISGANQWKMHFVVLYVLLSYLYKIGNMPEGVYLNIERTFNNVNTELQVNTVIINWVIRMLESRFISLKMEASSTRKRTSHKRVLYNTLC